MELPCGPLRIRVWCTCDWSCHNHVYGAIQCPVHGGGCYVAMLSAHRSHSHLLEGPLMYRPLEFHFNGVISCPWIFCCMKIDYNKYWCLSRNIFEIIDGIIKTSITTNQKCCAKFTLPRCKPHRRPFYKKDLNDIILWYLDYLTQCLGPYFNN